jgi:hypothetical protein
MAGGRRSIFGSGSGFGFGFGSAGSAAAIGGRECAR